jgi:hypothetical protein
MGSHTDHDPDRSNAGWAIFLHRFPSDDWGWVMENRESIFPLLMAVMVVNLMVMAVLIYAVMPDLMPGPVDDVALGAGAYALADRTGLLAKVAAILDVLVKGVGNDTE